MSEFDVNLVLNNVKAVNQTEFETNLLSKVDKAYKNHVNEEKSIIKKNLKETIEKIQTLSNAVKELNECLVYNLQHNKCSKEEFDKIRISLQNQIDFKKQEIAKLNRFERKYKDQLASFDISEKFNKILDGAGKESNKKLSSKPANSYDAIGSESSTKARKREKISKAKEPLEPEEISDSDDSDTSAASNRTMVFDHSNEQLEIIEPIVRKRKIVFTEESEVVKKKCQRIKPDKTVDDASYEEFCSRIIDHKNQLIADNKECDEGVEIIPGFIVPSAIWNRLYGYQQAGVRWLLQLHNNGAGGILGDEMGLGKTIQIIAFLAGLYRSKGANNYDCGAVLIVCPATVMRQWMNEFRIWAPLFRVALLHSTGSGYDKPQRLLDSIAHHPGVLVTTYSSMVLHQALLIRYDWQYVILDEGHKIKNPNAKVTHCCKQFDTRHRLIMSGSPIQNNLKELWSLVDFVYPGKLGSLASFIQNFAVPIMKGGYDHASPLQVETAYRCACVVRDTINEYLLRRTKAEVELQLPRKTEQVLFCGLTAHQNVVYREYLASKQCKQILAGQQVPFPGLVMLRKICNHPDLVTGGPKCVVDHPILGFSREASEDGNSYSFGHFSRSGKMVVVRELLKLWYRGKHKVLLFTQGRMMLNILKRFIEQQGYTMCVMDGTTAVGSRHTIVDKFNEAHYKEAFIFLLTTRVGGLGLNLVGADRVLVFDPDWNPCTDLQARERAWRIGQSRKVVIYRLVISGSVEEKIYHRQVFKQFLTNRILKNPRQRRFFKTQDLRDLFRLDDLGSASDTSIMFRGSRQHKSLKPNYFDDAGARLPIDAFGDDYDDCNDGNGREDDASTNVCQQLDLAELDMKEKEESANVLIAESGLSQKKLAALRMKARQLSKSLGANGSSQSEGGSGISKVTTATATKVEGEFITNVTARKEYKPPADNQTSVATDNSGSRSTATGADHIVSALLPNKTNPAGQSAANISYNVVCAAELVAERAKRSLDQTLANAGVTDKIYHDSVIADDSPDPALVQREAEAVAGNAVDWLRAQLSGEALGGHARFRLLFGRARNFFLWHKDEENSYFQNFDSTRSADSFHFNSNALDVATSTVKHARFSSPLLLTIIKNRSTNPTAKSHGTAVSTGAWDNTVVSNEVKTLTRNIHQFLTSGGTCRDGQITSKELVSHFRNQVSAKNNLLFKTILNQLCTFQRSTNRSNDGIWHLRVEFLNNKNK